MMVVCVLPVQVLVVTSTLFGVVCVWQRIYKYGMKRSRLLLCLVCSVSVRNPYTSLVLHDETGFAIGHLRSKLCRLVLLFGHMFYPVDLLLFWQK
jgi:hypothetical protein